MQLGFWEVFRLDFGEGGRDLVKAVNGTLAIYKALKKNYRDKSVFAVG